MEGEHAGTADPVSWSRVAASVVCPLPHLSLGHCFMEVQYASGSGALPMFFYFFNFLLLRLLGLLSWQPVLHPPTHAEGGVEGRDRPGPSVGVPGP